MLESTVKSTWWGSSFSWSFTSVPWFHDRMTSRLQVQEVCWVTNIPCAGFVTFKFLLDVRWCVCWEQIHSWQPPVFCQILEISIYFHIFPMICPSFSIIFPDLPWILFDQRGAGEATFCSCPAGNCRARPSKNQWISIFLLWRFGRFAPGFAIRSRIIIGLPPINRTQSHLDIFGFILRNLRNSMCPLNLDLNPMIFVLFFWICWIFGTRRSTFRGEASSLCKTRIVNWNSRPAMSCHVGYVGHRPAMSCFWGVWCLWSFPVLRFSCVFSFWRNYGNYLWTHSLDTWVIASKSSTHQKVVSKSRKVAVSYLSSPLRSKY